MKILAIEFSTAMRSVAVLEQKPSGDPTETAHAPAPFGEAREWGGRSTRAFALIDQALGQAGWEREQIERVAVGLGPGSYTGIRAAIALAQGWQLARSVQLTGIGGAEALASEAQTQKIFGSVSVVIDAQRGEFYAAAYHISPTSLELVEPLRLAGLEEIQARQRAGQILVGPELDRWFPEAKVLFPSALALARLALDVRETVAGENLTPIYLRETSFVRAPAPRFFRSGGA